MMAKIISKVVIALVLISLVETQDRVYKEIDIQNSRLDQKIILSAGFYTVNLYFEFSPRSEPQYFSFFLWNIAQIAQQQTSILDNSSIAFKDFQVQAKEGQNRLILQVQTKLFGRDPYSGKGFYQIVKPEYPATLTDDLESKFTFQTQNIIQNGGFQYPILKDQKSYAFKEIPGWKAVSGQIQIGPSQIYSQVWKSVDQVIQLNGWFAPATIVYKNQIPKGFYLLSFEYSKRAGAIFNKMLVYINQRKFKEYSIKDNQLHQQKLIFLSKGTNNAIQFRGAIAAQWSDSLGMIINNVELKVASLKSQTPQAAFPIQVTENVASQFKIGSNIILNGDFELPISERTMQTYSEIPGWIALTTQKIELGKARGYSTLWQANDQIIQLNGINRPIVMLYNKELDINATYQLSFQYAKRNLDVQGEDIFSLDWQVMYVYINSKRFKLIYTFDTELHTQKIIFKAQQNKNVIHLLGHYWYGIGMIINNVQLRHAKNSSYRQPSYFTEDLASKMRIDSVNILQNGDFKLPALKSDRTQWYKQIPGWKAIKDYIQLGHAINYMVYWPDTQQVIQLSGMNGPAKIAYSNKIPKGLYQLQFGYAKNFDYFDEAAFALYLNLQKFEQWALVDYKAHQIRIIFEAYYELNTIEFEGIKANTQGIVIYYVALRAAQFIQ